MSTISLEGMQFFAYHGCFKEEKVIGTFFRVDLYIETDTEEAEISDDLKKTIDYQAVYGMIKEEMNISSNLLEHVGRRILDRLFRDFPAAEAARIKVSKLNPPIGGQATSVSLSLERKNYK